jgi:hypothetical protein
MGIGKRLTAIVVSLLIGQGILSPAIADDTTNMSPEQIASLRMQLPSSLYDDIQNGHLYAGVAFSGGQDALPTQVSVLRTLPTLADRKTKLCRDYVDTSCLNTHVTEGLIVLPPCSIDSKSACLEGIKVGASSARKSGTLVRSVSNAISQELRDSINNDFDNFGARTISWQTKTSWAGVPSRGLPAAASPSIWRVPGEQNSGGTSDYLARATLKLEIDKSGSVRYTGLATEIVPFREISGSEFHAPTWVTRSATWTQMEWFPVSASKPLATYDNPTAFKQITCAWEEADKCGLAVKFSSGDSAEMTVRIPRELGGWFYGRLNNADLKLDPINGELNEVTISGAPANIPIASAQFQIFGTGNDRYRSYLTQGDADYLAELRTREQSGEGGLGSWGQWQATSGVSEFSAYETLMGTTAAGQVQMWSADTMPYWTTDNPCFADKTRVQGLLTTNAMVYQAGLPQFVNGQLSYQVAGLHNDFNGREFKGDYTLKMRADDARCLYGYSEGAIETSVAVTDFSGSKKSAATSVSEKNGWLTIRARDFTFSKKKLVVAIKQNGKKNVASVKTISASKGKRLDAKALLKQAKIKLKSGDKYDISAVGADDYGVSDAGKYLNFKYKGTYFVKVTVSRKLGSSTSRLFKVQVK